ncbi:MAG TPA: alpha-glucan family phosphorylase [Ilumatobacteraceae bacterium]|nr:alpha-glucan family phosphorylase [Ilumatobacteraceae bacterium]
MRAVRQFNVVPAIPARLAALSTLATNIHWSWDRQTQSLFARLDPVLWEASGHDPLRLIAAITATRWEELAADADVCTLTDEAARRLERAITEPRWFQGRESPLDLVAYFSPEFGLTETLPQYSGGLGILAGDHLKAASDLGIPLVAIGLLYAQGYFRQRLNADGYQEERFPRLDPHGLALTPTGAQVSVDLAGDTARLNVWQVKVGRINLYLLDAAVEGNSPDTAAVTDRLYGGDIEHRLRQEIVLGIGGVRALRALGLHPQVFHTNEGHAGFLSLERVRELVETGLSFIEAIEVARAGGVFTTHTPVPAGIDRFPYDLMQKYFTEFASSLGAEFDELMAIGRRPDEPDDDRFNMAVMGLRLAGRSNGVAKLHARVSRQMFQGVWPEVTIDEVPIGSVTNGVHAHTWVSDGVADLLASSVGPVWDGADAASWAGVSKLSPSEVWSMRAKGRAQLVSFVRSKFGEALLDPHALTIGFARRFATYKRATLLLSQPDRLRRLLFDENRPVQFVFAGKAHPADQPGKDMIREIELFARQLEVGNRFVFLQDYDMAVARTMLHGCDVWLNNPRRPFEACGTSGMKAALNGVLNCSILDGWWDECYDGSNGWAIASADDDPDVGRRDQREATSLFGLLEREIVPLFYDRDSNNVPVQWIDKMKDNWRSLGPFVTAARMVRDYTSELYEPAAGSATQLLRDDAARGRALAQWKQRVAQCWPQVKILDLDIDDTPAHEGDQRTVRVQLELGGLTPDEVTVQALHGQIDSAGSFVGIPKSVPLPAIGDATFDGTYTVGEAGPYGVTVRAIPQHPDLISPVELGLVAWAT